MLTPLSIVRRMPFCFRKSNGSACGNSPNISNALYHILSLFVNSSGEKIKKKLGKRLQLFTVTHLRCPTKGIRNRPFPSVAQKSRRPKNRFAGFSIPDFILPILQQEPPVLHTFPSEHGCPPDYRRQECSGYPPARKPCRWSADP